MQIKQNVSLLLTSLVVLSLCRYTTSEFDLQLWHETNQLTKSRKQWIQPGENFSFEYSFYQTNSIILFVASFGMFSILIQETIFV